MWQGTIAANREVRPSGAAPSAAAARFGTARYVTEMVSVTAAAATLEASLPPATTAVLPRARSSGVRAARYSNVKGPRVLPPAKESLP
jgi:hypothetical protein